MHILCIKRINWITLINQGFRGHPETSHWHLLHRVASNFCGHSLKDNFSWLWCNYSVVCQLAAVVYLEKEISLCSSVNKSNYLPMYKFVI